MIKAILPHAFVLLAACAPTKQTDAQLKGGLEREGWTLTFHDEFDGPALDLDRWNAFYRNNKSLPANYVIEDGVLHLRMDADKPPSRGGNSGRVSGIETRDAPVPFAQQY